MSALPSSAVAAVSVSVSSSNPSQVVSAAPNAYLESTKQILNEATNIYTLLAARITAQKEEIEKVGPSAGAFSFYLLNKNEYLRVVNTGDVTKLITDTEIKEIKEKIQRGKTVLETGITKTRAHLDEMRLGFTSLSGKIATLDKRRLTTDLSVEQQATVQVSLETAAKNLASVQRHINKLTAYSVALTAQQTIITTNINRLTAKTNYVESCLHPGPGFLSYLPIVGGYFAPVTPPRQGEKSPL